MNNEIIFRKEILNSCISHFRQDKRYCLLIGDMGFGAMDKIKAEFPDRVFQCGIMEQNMVGVAAGMAMSGMVPVVYSIVNFLVFRALEQIRNDIVLQNLNVKLIGTGANDYFKFLGHSHICGQDDIALMKLINLPVYDPFTDNRSFQEIVDDWLDSKRAGYIRT